jgi:hypothetical protein
VYRVGAEVTLQVMRVDIASQKMALSTRDPADLEISAGRPRSGGGGGRSEGRRGGAPRSTDVRVWMDREVSEPKKEEENVGSLGAALMAALAKNDKD